MSDYILIPTHGGKDPDGMNDIRTECGGHDIKSIMDETGTELDNALPDILANLMHWASANNVDFTAELVRAGTNFKTETR